MNLQNIPQIKHLDSGNFFVLAGPCAIEGEEMAFQIAERIYEITHKFRMFSRVLSKRQTVREWILLRELEMKRP